MILNATHPLCVFLFHPDDSSSCARCILGAMSIGIGSGRRRYGEEIFWRQFVQDVDFWNAHVRFLFAVRTEEQIQQLLDRLNHCSCRINTLDMREYHRVGRSVEEDLQSASITLIAYLFWILSCALDSVNLKAVAKRTTYCWPTCPEDLMPFGPKNLADSFIAWSRCIPDTLMFRTAAQCIKLCGSLLIPYAIQSALTQSAVDAGRKLFDRTWAAVSSSSKNKQMKAIEKAFAAQLKPLMAYFQFYNEQPIEEKATMLDAYELKAVEVFSLFTYLAHDSSLLLASPETFARRNSLAEVGFQIAYCMSQYFDPMPAILVHPEIYKKYKSPPKDSPHWESSDMPKYDPTHPDYDVEVALEALYVYFAREVIKSIRKIRLGLSCSARDCSNSIHSTGRAFSRCGACKVASYCSKKCQVASWNCTPFAHKSICKILQKIVATAGSGLLFDRDPEASSNQSLTLFAGSYAPPEDFVAVITKKWQDENVPRAELLKVLGWISCKLISPLPTKAECAPGYADYEDIIRELSKRDGALEAEYMALESVSLEEFDEYRSTLDK